MMQIKCDSPFVVNQCIDSYERANMCFTLKTVDCVLIGVIGSRRQMPQLGADACESQNHTRFA